MHIKANKIIIKSGITWTKKVMNFLREILMKNDSPLYFVFHEKTAER